MQTKPTIWLLSAYRSASHAAWADWLVETFNEFNWQRLELPGRHFRWRIRGNPLSWLDTLPTEIPDLILATSMVDLATLKGLHPQLATTNCIYYFHENQFAYPASQQQHESIDPQMVQLYGALAANSLVFNSVYNRDSFLNGVDQLLKKLPDEVPDNIVTRLKSKSNILPVAINPVTTKHKREEKLILWNHRWEYDKAPEVFVEALLKLKKHNCDFKLALLGDRPLKTPAPLLQIEQQFGNRIFVNKKVSRQDYLKYLSQASIVISTAIHEFQGLSVLEAVSAGCSPLVPDDLCYKEQYPAEYRYKSGSSDALAEKLTDWLENTPPVAPDVSSWYSENLNQHWLSIINTNIYSTHQCPLNNP